MLRTKDNARNWNAILPLMYPFPHKMQNRDKRSSTKLWFELLDVTFSTCMIFLLSLYTEKKLPETFCSNQLSLINMFSFTFNENMDFINPEQRKDLQLAELFPSLIYLYAFTFNEYRHPTYIKLVKQVLTVGRTTSQYQSHFKIFF